MSTWGPVTVCLGTLALIRSPQLASVLNACFLSCFCHLRLRGLALQCIEVRSPAFRCDGGGPTFEKSGR